MASPRVTTLKALPMKKPEEMIYLNVVRSLESVRTLPLLASGVRRSL
jgi:hypothetical protein